MKRNKIPFFLLIFLSFSCKPDYIQNKFKVKEIKVSPTENPRAVELKFAVEYYSDSTNSNYFSEGIEKGQDGSNFEIIEMGFKNKVGQHLKVECDEITIIDFINMFNSKQKMYRGEMIQKPKRICVDSNSVSNKESFYILFKDTISNQTFTTIADWD